MSNPNTEIEKGDTPPCPDANRETREGTPASESLLGALIKPKESGSDLITRMAGDLIAMTSMFRGMMDAVDIDMNDTRITARKGDGTVLGEVTLEEMTSKAEATHAEFLALPAPQEPAPSPERQGALWTGAEPADFAEARYQSGFCLSSREADTARWFFDAGKLAGAAK